MAKVTIEMQDLIDTVVAATGEGFTVKDIRRLVENLSSFERNPLDKWNAHFIAKIPKGLRVFNRRTGDEILDGSVIDAVENPDLLCLYDGKGWEQRSFADLPRGAVVQLGIGEDAKICRFRNARTCDGASAHAIGCEPGFALNTIFRVIEVPNA